GRSDSIMLIRTGGGHAARLSIPRDTVVEIPGHGLQKVNAAHAFGGPALSISVIKQWLGVPINHVVEVNFENFPQLIDSMGGVDYTGRCVISRIDGGFSRGGYTLRLPQGTHHIDGRAALALARTRENLCAPGETDLQRAEHQQALFTAMKGRLLSPSSFFRRPRRPCPQSRPGRSSHPPRSRRRPPRPAAWPRPTRRPTRRPPRAGACACRSRCCRSPSS